MNKRMVTHLIGLGLVGLSATGWAEELQVMVADIPGVLDGQNLSIGQAGDERVGVIKFRNIQADEKIWMDIKTGISILESDIASALDDPIFFTNEGAGGIFAAQKGVLQREHS